MQEYINDKEEDYYNDWFNDNKSRLELCWWETVPADELPLDDDMSDYLDDHYDEFMDFARECFKERLED